MSSSATTRSANLTADMTKSSLLQNHMILIAHSVGSPCERCIQVSQQFISEVQGSIQQINRAYMPPSMTDNWATPRAFYDKLNAVNPDMGLHILRHAL